MTRAQFSRDDILRQASRAEGREEGREIERRNNALKFYRLGVDEQIIANATGYDIEKLHSLIEEEKATDYSL